MDRLLSVRRLSYRDLPAAAALEAQCFPSAWNAEQYMSAFREPWFAAYGIFSGCVLLGYLVLSLAAGEAEVLNIAVLPEFRGQGAGSELMRFALWDARDRWELAHLEVRPSNAPAVALYEKNGFRISGRRKGYYADGEDALVMTLESSDFSPREETA